MGTVVVRYRAKTESANENQRLIENVFDELARANPDGVCYSAYRLEDDSFVHVANIGGDENPLSTLKAFKAFQENIADRCLPGETPSVKSAHLVGSFASSTANS